MIVPTDYQKLDSLPEDPDGCVSYGKQTENALCMVSIYPIAPEDAMDFNDKKALIDGIHHTLAENQALIEVDNGRRLVVSRTSIALSRRTTEKKRAFGTPSFWISFFTQTVPWCVFRDSFKSMVSPEPEMPPCSHTSVRKIRVSQKISGSLIPMIRIPRLPTR